MELHVESTRIAHRLALGVSAPQSGGRGVTVGTGQSKPPGGRLESSTRGWTDIKSFSRMHCTRPCVMSLPATSMYLVIISKQSPLRQKKKKPLTCN